MKHLSDLHKAIDIFNEEYPRPGIKPIGLSERYDIRKDFLNRSYPNSDFPGVYILFDENMNILRIGKASCDRALGSRLSDYFEYGPDKEGVAKDSDYKVVRYLMTIGLSKDRAFEAPAIEEYLIGKLDSDLNKTGR
jgi:hypothetical protein